MLDRIAPEPCAFFLMRAKKNLKVTRRYSHAVYDRQAIACDQTMMLTREVVARKCPASLRRLRVRDAASGESIVLLTNHFALPAPTVSALYRQRWQSEIFFKWIRQHLRIKAFYETSPNAMKTQV